MARSGVMLAHLLEETKIKRWVPPYLAQPKLNGNRCRTIFIDHKVTLLSSEENEIVSVPHINAQLENLGICNGELDGELYVHGWRVNQIRSVVSRKNSLHKDYKLMEYHIFDKIFDAPQYHRIDELSVIKLKTVNEKNLFVEDTRAVNNLNDAMIYFDELVCLGYEGIILRNKDGYYERKRSCNLLKFKPKERGVYDVVGFEEEIDKYSIPKDTLGSFYCVTPGGEVFGVGTKLTNHQRDWVWMRRDLLEQKECKILVQYQELTSDRKVPYHSAFLGLYVDGEKIIFA